MRNRIFAAAGAVLILSLTAGAASAAERNIVLIVADDHGCDAGCYGNPVIKTPAIDALAAEGTLFTHAFCTTASCSPSRSVILTGMHNHANGMFGLEHRCHHFQSYANDPMLLEKIQRAMGMLVFGATPKQEQVRAYMCMVF